MAIFRFQRNPVPRGALVPTAPARAASSAIFPARIAPQGTFKGVNVGAGRSFTVAQHFHASMAAQAARVPRLANLQVQLAKATRGAGARTARR